MIVMQPLLHLLQPLQLLLLPNITTFTSAIISIITNIGFAHIGNFLEPKDIAKEKASIYDSLNEESFALIPNDSPYSKLLIKRASSKTQNIVLFGVKGNTNSSFNKIKENEKIPNPKYPDN